MKAPQIGVHVSNNENKTTLDFCLKAHRAVFKLRTISSQIKCL